MKKIKIDRAIQERPATRKQTRNEKIRQSLTEHVDVQVIPAITDREGYEKPKLRVCAYCRVSTDMDTQALSYELQVQNYTDYIRGNDEWQFAGIYADRGISGTSLKHRDEFNRMIEDCKAGKIDLIITKAVTRFARNVLDCISTIRMLKQLEHPVAVYFETERINTLDTTSETYLGLISLFAQGESESKSESLKWSYIRRWKRGTGIYPTWSLLGYEMGEDGKWQIVEAEAELVRIIYDMYLNGYSSPQIAEILTRSGVPTATNQTVWSSGGVLGILRNEKYCGNVLCQKTMTVDVFSHKAIKNTGQKTQYFIEGHHEPIILKSDWDRVQQMIDEKYYRINNGRAECDSHHVNEDVLEATYLTAMRRLVDSAEEVVEVVRDGTELALEPENKAAMDRIDEETIQLQEAALALHKAKQRMEIGAVEYASRVKEYSERMKELEAERNELQGTAAKYAEVRMWLDTFIEQTMQSDTLTTVDGTTMKMLVDRIHVRNDGIVVEFKCGVAIEQEYVK